jgi:hypothetical protein
VPDEYGEADLNKGEMVCIDRCVSKFYNANVKIGEVSEEQQRKSRRRQQQDGTNKPAVRADTGPWPGYARGVQEV